MKSTSKSSGISSFNDYSLDFGTPANGKREGGAFLLFADWVGAVVVCELILIDAVSVNGYISTVRDAMIKVNTVGYQE